MVILDQIDSTQLELKRRLQNDQKLPHLSFVQAHRQTGGVGRREREWLSPEGNLYLSVLLRGPHVSVTWVPLWVASNLKAVIDSRFKPSRSFKLKWPNDLMVEPFAKISGILSEKMGDHVIAGIGLNVSVSPAVHDREVTCLQDCISSDLPKETLNQIREDLIAQLSKPIDLARLKNEFENDSMTAIGSEIEWLDLSTQSTSTGKVLGLGQYGELKVLTANGEVSLFSEEVTAVRSCPGY
jgi:biotin-[acetyl-CoA-carboxylase] ligase BirA-like protein